MRTVTVRDVQHNLAEVLSWVERGEEVGVLRRRKLVAKLIPPDPVPAASPDFVGRAREIWGDRPKGRPLSELLSESRGDR